MALNLTSTSPLKVCLAALFFGCLATSKMSWILILPAIVLIFVVRVVIASEKPNLTKSILTAIAAMGLAACVIWAMYGFRYSAAPPGALDVGAPIIREAHHAGLPAAAMEALIKYKLLPESFILGLSDVFGRMTIRDGFANGHYSINGWWWFFPFCFLIKTPVPMFALLGATAWVLLRRRKKGVVYQSSPLILFIAVYFAFAMASGMSIGHRHLLPIYPALFILAGAAALVKKQQIIVLPCLGFFIFGSVYAWPHYLSYFNAASGASKKGYTRLVDSSLDWGQDLPALSAWLKDHSGNNQTVYLSYFGTASPEYFGIQARPLPPNPSLNPGLAPLEPGLYCISATHLQQLYTGVLGPWSAPLEEKYQALSRQLKDAAASGRAAMPTPILVNAIEKFKLARFARLCSVLRQRRPDAMAGYSILIFDVDEAELDKALNQAMTGLPIIRNIKGAGPYTLFGKNKR